MLRHFIQVCVIACVGIGAFADVGHARTPFDGNWSVLIVTQRGNCDRAYRYGVQIVNGRVLYNGGVVNFSGRVSSRGQVSVSVSSGSARANGSGRLSRNAGTGRWSGVSGSDRCSGYWTAERRG